MAEVSDAPPGPTSARVLLDEAATAVFGGPRGARRIAPLLERWNADGLKFHEGDPTPALLHTLRTDWALCDASIENDDGETYLERLLRGRIDGVEPMPRWARLRAQHLGLFEVWPGTSAWLRDLRCGLCIALEDPPFCDAPDDEGPTALWEVRVLLRDGRAQLCSAPLPYPLGILDRLHAHARQRLETLGETPPVSWRLLRRGWLAASRAPRADPGTLFRI